MALAEMSHEESPMLAEMKTGSSFLQDIQSQKFEKIKKKKNFKKKIQKKFFKFFLLEEIWKKCDSIHALKLSPKLTITFKINCDNDNDKTFFYTITITISGRY
jgi:hypothetical protein